MIDPRSSWCLSRGCRERGAGGGRPLPGVGSPENGLRQVCVTPALGAVRRGNRAHYPPACSRSIPMHYYTPHTGDILSTTIYYY